ncbi:MAG: NitT/TauT family transport system substrate-binding protein [Candidatus Pelagisphaera sp.]|jgi:NitT/TauT family transport system substrate-binding protein
MRISTTRRITRSLIALSSLLLITCGLEAKPLKVGYSDWPGWVAWEVAIEKQWFKEAGVDVEFEWFDYLASMDAFAAGQLDAVCMTNGDALLTGATGAANVMILINDFSNGNDMIVAAPGIGSIKDLKGKKIGVEIGLVGHLLLLKGLESVGLSEDDVELINMPTDQAAQTLASGDVDAIVAWQPNSGQALKAVVGSKKVFSSADRPGLIYDTLAVSPESLAARRADWENIVSVWYRIVDYIKDPATRPDAIAIMASRVDLPADEYKPFLSGTFILAKTQAKIAYQNKEGFKSIYGSSKIVDAFSVANKMYDDAQDIESYIDPSLTQ